MISAENKMISNSYAELRDFGFLVYNFNTQRRMTHGATNKLCDLIVMGNTGLHFIEVKLKSTSDTMKPDQIIFKKIIELVSKKTPYVHYWMIRDLEDAHAVFDMILSGTPDQKGEALGV